MIHRNHLLSYLEEQLILDLVKMTFEYSLNQNNSSEIILYDFYFKAINVARNSTQQKVEKKINLSSASVQKN